MNTFTTAAQSIGDPIKELKRVKLEAIRDFHQPLIEDLGINRLDFNMKMVFYNKTGTMVVGIFASEFKKEKGLFFELVDRDFNPIEASRSVYRIAPNDSFHEEFEQNEKGSYLVPLEELRKINKDAVYITKGEYLKTMDADGTSTVETPVLTETVKASTSYAYRAPATMEDAPTSEMTIRDYMAIHTGKPVSAKAWLNDLIKQSSK